MNKNVKFISDELAYRYKPNNSIEKEILDKVIDNISDKDFAGNFYSSSWSGGGDGYLYFLDDYDKWITRNIGLKEGEKIFRYFTRKSAISGSIPFIKINIDKGLLYYLKPDDEGLDLIEFETKGIPARYLNIIESEREEYAEGGMVYDFEKEQDPRGEQLKGRTILFEGYRNEEGEFKPLHTKITKVRLPSTSYKNPTLTIEHSYGNNFWLHELKGDEIDKFLSGEEIYLDKDKLFRIKLMKEMAEGGIIKSYLSSRSDMFNKDAETLSKQDVVDFIPLTLDSNSKYWVKDVNTGFSYYIHKGKLRLNDSTEGIFKATITTPDRLSNNHEFKINAQDLYDWEKESDPSIVKVGWDSIKEKFGNIFYMGEDGEDEIFANEVKIEERTYNWDGRPSPYTKRVSFSDAEYMFLKSLTDEEKAMIELEHDYKDVHELFGVMSEKRFIVKRKKNNSKYANGGKLSWQNVQVGDSALVKAENKMGVVTVTYGRRFHLRFPDGSEKTYSAEELEFIQDDSYGAGGEIENLVGRTITMYDMGVPEPAYYDISRVEMSPPQFSIKSLKLYHKHGMNEFVDVIEGADINKFLKGEQVDLRDSGGDYYAIQLTEKMESKMKKGGDLKVGYKDAMMFDKNGERRVDPEAIAYIENTNAMLTQTKFLHTDKNGKYTPSRRKLHEKIIAHFHEDKPCVNKRPAIAILTGGAPASGKTTFIKKFVDLDPEKVYHIDADEVRAMLPEYKGWNASQTHLETADIVNRLIDDIGEPCDHDMIYDGTMNKATKYEKIVDKLHKLGYKVFVVYISIPEQVSKERVISRYKNAGRYVPMQVIEEVYDNGLTAFEKVAREMADGYIRIDGMNGDVLEKGGMEMPKNIEYAQGGEVDSSYLKNADSLVRSAERYAQETSGKEVSKGKGMARATKKDGKMKYTEVIVFFKNGDKEVYDESEFPKFFMKDGGEVGSQDYYDGFQMQVVTKKGNPDKEVQKQNAMFKYRKGGKL